MSQAGLSGPAPQGAGRNYTWFNNQDVIGSTGGVNRHGQVISMAGAATNLGSFGAINGAGTELKVLLPTGGTTLWDEWVGVRQLVPRVVFFTQRPVKSFEWENGRYTWEAVFSWPVAFAGGVESGICFPQTDIAPYLSSQSHFGLAVYNFDGKLQFLSRNAVGAGGIEIVDLSAWAGPVTGYNKVAISLCLATGRRPARVVVRVNDAMALVREWTGAHKLPAFGNYTHPTMCHGANPTFCYTTQMAWGWGRDYEDL